MDAPSHPVTEISSKLAQCADLLQECHQGDTQAAAAGTEPLCAAGGRGGRLGAGQAVGLLLWVVSFLQK